MNNVAEFLARLFGKLKHTPEAEEQEPIRGELYSVERLEQTASLLASEHKVVSGQTRGRTLLPRLEDNGRRLIAAYRALADAIRNERAISPAAEWLVDNFHIVEEQLREIREDLPKGYYYELPKLANGELGGYPRIYAIALTLIAHTDSRLDTETLRRFIHAYQQTTPLSIGELWAVAITLRLALVENLRRLAIRIVASRDEREEADHLADKLLELAERQPDAIVSFLNERLGKRERLGSALVVQLTGRLREQDPAVMPAFDWLERYLARTGQNTEQFVHLEHQRQASAQVTVGNIITSMRFLSTLDWRDFFESVSLTEPLLGDDPAGVYPRMDFATRDRYRHIIEGISKRTETSELTIAERAVQLAQSSYESDPEDAALSHVGYYLIDDGLAQLEKAFAYKTRLGERVRRFVLRHPTLVYLGTLSFLTALIISVLVFYGLRSGASAWVLVSLVVLSLIPASDLALGVLNWDITHLLPPRLLPKMDTRRGVPPEGCTMIVVPTLFTSEEVVGALFDKLEIHYLANQDEQFYFALLGDFADAASAEMPGDGALLELALDRLEQLNARYPSDDDEAPRFHLFHRRRKWN